MPFRLSSQVAQVSQPETGAQAAGAHGAQGAAGAQAAQATGAQERTRTWTTRTRATSIFAQGAQTATGAQAATGVQACGALAVASAPSRIRLENISNPPMVGKTSLVGTPHRNSY